eukprot:131250-Amphidinium_carterae.1
MGKIRFWGANFFGNDLCPLFTLPADPLQTTKIVEIVKMLCFPEFLSFVRATRVIELCNKVRSGFIEGLRAMVTVIIGQGIKYSSTVDLKVVQGESYRWTRR